MTLHRKKPLPRRKAYIERSKKPIARLNVKRARRQADKYAAHLKSAHFRWVKEQVRERSEGRCERILIATDGSFRRDPFVGEVPHLFGMRCPNKAEVFNHTSYSKVPNEPPEHVEHLCKPCDREYEGARPWRASRRAALSRAEKAS